MRGKSRPVDHDRLFVIKTAGHNCLKVWLGWLEVVSPALLRTDAGSMRQILETLSTRPILSKEPACRLIAVFPCGRRVSNLPHTSGFNVLMQRVLTYLLGKLLQFRGVSR